MAGQGLENPIQTPGEMGLEQNVKQPVVTNRGAAEHRKAGRLWSTWKCWSLGWKTTQRRKNPTDIFPDIRKSYPKVHLTDPNLCQFVSETELEISCLAFSYLLHYTEHTNQTKALSGHLFQVFCHSLLIYNLLNVLKINTVTADVTPEHALSQNK